jgi:hypothetical protein
VVRDAVDAVLRRARAAAARVHLVVDEELAAARVGPRVDRQRPAVTWATTRSGTTWAKALSTTSATV